MKNKQTLIINYLNLVESATKQEIFNQVAKTWYYENGMKHLGDVLARLVKVKKIKRLGRGVYMLSKKSPTPQEDLNQINLF